jgi:flagellar M-ring protein FliF
VSEEKSQALAEAQQKAAAMGGSVRFNEQGVPVAVAAGQKVPAFTMPEQIQDLLLLDVPQSYEHRLEYVKRLVDDDSKIVASVIKSWVKKDG